MGTSFNEQFDQHGAWRREFALRLKLLSEWMKDHELLDSAVEERLAWLPIGALLLWAVLGLSITAWRLRRGAA